MYWNNVSLLIYIDTLFFLGCSRTGDDCSLFASQMQRKRINSLTPRTSFEFLKKYTLIYPLFLFCFSYSDRFQGEIVTRKIKFSTNVTQSLFRMICTSTIHSITYRWIKFDVSIWQNILNYRKKRKGTNSKKKETNCSFSFNQSLLSMMNQIHV
jgi:hypothetical protein